MGAALCRFERRMQYLPLGQTDERARRFARAGPIESCFAGESRLSERSRDLDRLGHGLLDAGRPRHDLDLVLAYRAWSREGLHDCSGNQAFV
jgi:hypothetical protein